jgi:hypothetical protein
VKCIDTLEFCELTFCEPFFRAGKGEEGKEEGKEEGSSRGY